MVWLQCVMLLNNHQYNCNITKSFLRVREPDLDLYTWNECLQSSEQWQLTNHRIYSHPILSLTYTGTSRKAGGSCMIIASLCLGSHTKKEPNKYHISHNLTFPWLTLQCRRNEKGFIYRWCHNHTADLIGVSSRVRFEFKDRSFMFSSQATWYA